MCLNAKEERIDKILESLNLQGIESLNEQQQQSAKTLIKRISAFICFDLELVGHNLFGST